MYWTVMTVYFITDVLASNVHGVLQLNANASAAVSTGRDKDHNSQGKVLQ